MSLEKWGNTSPLGMLRFAHEYHVAASVLHGSQELSEFSMPAYSLIGQSIELSLKAFLRARGFSEKELQAIGHNLAKALKEARSSGLHRIVSLPDFHDESIRQLSDPYRGQRFRYIVNGPIELPKWDLLYLSSHLLIIGLHNYVVRASLGREEGRLTIRNRGFVFRRLKASGA